MTSRRLLYVLGSRGLAKEMAQLAFATATAANWEFAGFVAGDASQRGEDLGYGFVTEHDDSLLAGDWTADLVVAIGQPDVRARVLRRYLDQGDRFAFPNLVHPDSRVDPAKVTLGRGNCITAGCTFTCDIAVADFNLFNLHTTVGHDVRVGSFNVLNPSVNVSGNVTIGSEILVGTGAQILERLTIGDKATVGAGAVVTKNVASGQTVVGVPARPTTGF